MYPVVKEKSENDDQWFNSLLAVISGFQCDNYFTNHLGKSQCEQKTIVSNFQQSLYKMLSKSFPQLKWKTEYLPSINKKDSIDIFGETDSFVVAIELDKNRADQVAKKFVSRVALMPNKKVYFISLCYPGTKNMNINECIKYFGYCSNIAVRMSGVYAGLVVEKI